MNNTDKIKATEGKMMTTSFLIKFALALLIIVSYFTVSAQDSRDKKFVRCAGEAGITEVKLGELAVSKGNITEVKTHAQRMIDDHGKANEELKSLAAKKNIPMPSYNDKMKKKYDKLAKLTGKTFDKHYTHCMIHAHKKALCLFKKEAKKSDDTELSSWANGKVPVIESHLAMWKQTCKAVKESKAPN